MIMMRQFILELPRFAITRIMIAMEPLMRAVHYRLSMKIMMATDMVILPLACKPLYNLYIMFRIILIAMIMMPRFTREHRNYAMVKTMTATARLMMVY